MAIPSIAEAVVRVVAQGSVDVDTIGRTVDSSGVTAWDWVRAAAILTIAVLIAVFGRRFMIRIAVKRADAPVADLLGRVVAYLVVILGLIYALDVVGVRLAPLLGALGIIGIAAAFGLLKDILENLVAGFLLQIRRPFSYGDQILTGEIEGTVLGVDSRAVSLLTLDGETVLLPSSDVISKPIVNHTSFGMRRTDLTVGIAYGSDLSAVTRVLADAVLAAEGVHRMPTPEVLFHEFGPSGIDFTVRYWHGPTVQELWAARHEVGLSIDRATKRHGIEIPLPQRVLWSRTEVDDGMGPSD